MDGCLVFVISVVFYAHPIKALVQYNGVDWHKLTVPGEVVVTAIIAGGLSSIVTEGGDTLQVIRNNCVVLGPLTNSLYGLCGLIRSSNFMDIESPVLAFPPSNNY